MEVLKGCAEGEEGRKGWLGGSWEAWWGGGELRGCWGRRWRMFGGWVVGFEGRWTMGNKGNGLLGADSQVIEVVVVSSLVSHGVSLLVARRCCLVEVVIDLCLMAGL